MTTTQASTRTLRTDKGVVVTTTLTDGEAVEIVARIRGNDFGQRLVRDFRRYRGLYPNKLAWLHKLALEQLDRDFAAFAATVAEQTELAPSDPALAGDMPTTTDELAATAPLNHRPAPAPAAPTFAGIVRFLTPASQSLKTGACVTFTFEGVGTVRIKRAGRASRYPGTYWVTDGRAYPNSTCYGRVNADGSFVAHRAMTPAVEEVLIAFDKDPITFAKQYGVRTGNCCFCATKLDDPNSLVLGYGPVCAKHYGLPHGKRAGDAARAAQAERCCGGHAHA